MKRELLVLSLAFGITSAATSATAMAPFKKVFEDKYIKQSDDDGIQAAYKKAACNTCHVKDKKKDVVNAYGWELSKLVEGIAKDRVDIAAKRGSGAKKEEEAKLLREFETALKKVESMKHPSGKTYSELFKAHEVPNSEGAKSIRSSP